MLPHQVAPAHATDYEESADALVWEMQRRVVLADRAERLRKELAEIDAEVARLGAAEVVIGRFVDAQRAGAADDPAVAEEFEPV
ncbi:hypothetical protein [Streptomyces sp. NPDC058683]|uniref:hypothetical protein n=1 Tax=Streptomyces sp. NPDC058683 TaxID=3346597 RepID=UPI0036583A22